MALDDQVSSRLTQPSETFPTKRFTEEATVPISIKFKNLSYSVKEKRSKFKEILRSVSGQFSSGELTAILGASGSGKTTLLNILSGYVKNNGTGTVEMNDEVCDAKLLRKLSAYVMQRDLLQSHLTVEEQLMFVAKLKLPNSFEEKQLMIHEFLNVMNLRNCAETRLEKLSGGERERLAIAIELVNSPSVIFLDEPTSGLDPVAINLCMDIFRQLSGAGKTVICTIHQPSVSTLSQFNQVYFLAKGSCIYNGSTENIPPFLTSLDLNCPITWNYSEFIIETGETNPEAIELLSNAVQNGKINNRKLDNAKKHLLPYQNQKIKTYYNSGKFHVPFWTQCNIIFRRMMLQQWRNKVGLMIQLLFHICVAILLGTIFSKTGNSAKNLMSNVYFSWICVMIFVYNCIMTYVTVFPIEMQILKKEYLNGWYSLKAYYLALSIRSLPNILVLGTGMSLSSYIMSGQPMEMWRCYRFILTCILTGIATEGLGLLMGSTFGTLGGTVFAPALIGPICLIPLHGMEFGSSMSLSSKIISRLSYMSFATTAAVYAIMEDRPPINCSEIFCYYKDAKHLLRDIGMPNNHYYLEILGLLAYGLLFRVLAYWMIKYRMQQELRSDNSDFLAKLLQLEK